MKKTISLIILFAVTFFITGCNDSTSTKIMEKDLLHHRFVLIKANGEDISPDKQIELQFGENMNISGKICNDFAASVELNNNIIKSSEMTMTKTLCNDDQLDKLDSIIEQLITKGAEVSLDKDLLTLKNKDNELIYKLKDLM